MDRLSESSNPLGSPIVPRLLGESQFGVGFYTAGVKMFARAALFIFCLGAVAACGAGEPDRDPIRLQANAVGGGQLHYSDLASQDTVLWFWAPW